MTNQRPTPLPLPRFVMEDDDELPTVVRESGIQELFTSRQTSRQTTDDSVRVVVDLAANDDAGARGHTRLSKAARPTTADRDEPGLENESLGVLLRIYERRAETELRPPAPPQERLDDVGEEPPVAQRPSRLPAPVPARAAPEAPTLLSRAEIYFGAYDFKRWVAFVAASAAISSLMTVLLTR